MVGDPSPYLRHLRDECTLQAHVWGISKYGILVLVIAYNSSIVLTIKFGMSIVQIPNITTIIWSLLQSSYFFHRFKLDMTIHVHKCQHGTLHNQSTTSDFNNPWHKYFVSTKAQWMIWSKHSCRLWIIGHNSRSLKLRAIAKFGDLMPMVMAMKSYSRAEGLNIKDWALEGTRLFGSTWWKLDLPPSVECNSHQNELLYSFSTH